MKPLLNDKIEVWGGIECTINRVDKNYLNQLDYSGHYNRENDINTFAPLGFKKMRYPLLWEKHEPEQGNTLDWLEVEANIYKLRAYGTDIIAGLVHHGSGPAYVNILDDSFAEGLAAYAYKVAQKFPWIEYYTPVNEPLTTARFCGLYGLWYPHKKDDKDFCRILINECKGTVLAMQAIRKINPDAKLVQTDDLGKTHSTPLLRYQANFENHRRWLSYDLLCGLVNSKHPLWGYLIASGITRNELEFFEDNTCKPDIIGLNHYLTSERYIDENIQNYPVHTHGGNKKHQYADTEAVRVGSICPDGPYNLFKEAWDRYKLPIAVTEVHLYCTREEQMRWLNQIWLTANKLKNDGVNIKAITAWALLGSFGWNRLLTQPHGDYEPGVFDLSNGEPRQTALAKMISAFNNNKQFKHPVISSKGWWQRECRVIYGTEAFFNVDNNTNNSQPLLIIGKTGTLGNAFAKICAIRGIYYKLVGRDEIDITKPLKIEEAVLRLNPWAIVNTAGFVRVDDAEKDFESCFAVNTYGAENLALICRKYGVKMLTFSSDLVFDGFKNKPYTEHDTRSPLNVYGQSKALAEEKVLRADPSALVIRTSAFFGPWDKYNFITVALNNLQQGNVFSAANDVMVSPTYVPDLVNASLDLLLDDEKGIWHLTNNGQISWAELAYTVAERSGLKTSLIKAMPLMDFGLKAQRPMYSVLSSNRGSLLSTLDNAIDRCLIAIE